MNEILDSFDIDREVEKFNDVILKQSNGTKAKILISYLHSIIDVDIKHFDDFSEHKSVLEDIESKVNSAISLLKTISD